MNILYSESDFDWLKLKNDADAKHHHRHVGKPERYPCVVSETEFWDDPNGPYTLTYSFLYRDDNKCETCGHTSQDWPERVRVALAKQS